MIEKESKWSYPLLLSLLYGGDLLSDDRQDLNVYSVEFIKTTGRTSTTSHTVRNTRRQTRVKIKTVHFNVMVKFYLYSSTLT